MLTALAEGRAGVEILDEWPDLNGPVLRASVLYGALLAFQEQHGMSEALRAERAVATGGLGPEDRHRLDGFFLYHGGCRMRDRWFEYHLDRWDRFATSLDELTASWDESYISDIAEYGNDLSHRDILDEALALLSPEGQALVEPFVARVDERLRACTRPVDTPVEPGAGSADGKGWWWFRIPLSVGGSFERQLAERVPRPGER